MTRVRVHVATAAAATMLLAAGALLCPATSPAARADSLYVSDQAPAQAQHLRLGPDLRAANVGDLLAVRFDFTANAAASDTNSTKKDFTAGLGKGFVFGPIRLPTSVSGATGSDATHARAATNSFSSTMMARVVGIDPSGALQIAGDQLVTIDGRTQLLHIRGLVRPTDIDSTDAVLSSRVANVQAAFDGDFQAKNPGLVRKILDALF